MGGYDVVYRDGDWSLVGRGKGNEFSFRYTEFEGFVGFLSRYLVGGWVFGIEVRRRVSDWSWIRDSKRFRVGE